jgi:hypothetical protein
MGKPNFYYGYALVLSIVVCLQARADDTGPEPPTQPFTEKQNQAMVQVREELTNLERRWYGLVRVKYGYPQRLAAGLGAIFVDQPKSMDCLTGCALRGWHFEIEPGRFGIQGSVGWGKLIGETGRNGRLLHTVHFGWNVRGVVFRSWRDSSLRPKEQTLVGAEFGLSIIRLNFSVGILRSLASDRNQDWVGLATVGWGY